MGDGSSIRRRSLQWFHARAVRDLRDLDARGRLENPLGPLSMAAVIFVLVGLLGLAAFGLGRSAGALFVHLLLVCVGVFGIAVTVGWALAAAQYRAVRQADSARVELLSLQRELDATRQEAGSRLHDARALVAAMGAALHALRRSPTDPAVTAALTGQLDHLRALLTDAPSAPLEPVAAAEFLLEARSFADLHGMTLLHDAPADAAVLADRGRLTAILRNLIDNARKYAPGSPVLIACEPAGPYWKVVVQDDGPGIGTADGEGLFLPGVRGEHAAQGFGMGLAIARRHAEAMHGALWHELRPGRGSRFVLKLRRADDPPGASPEEAP